MNTLLYTDKLLIEHCCNCGMTFGIIEDFYNQRRNDHKMFYCPAGHPQYYNGKSEAEKLKEQLQLEIKDKEWYVKRVESLHTNLTKSNHQVRAQKAAKTRLANRVKNGVCPCCTRTFSNLANHMKTKHPEYKE